MAVASTFEADDADGAVSIVEGVGSGDGGLAALRFNLEGGGVGGTSDGVEESNTRGGAVAAALRFGLAGCGALAIDATEISSPSDIDREGPGGLSWRE